MFPQCETVCDKQFNLKGNLTQNIRIHTGESNYECEHCDYKSVTKHSLDYHNASKHTGEKTYQCEISVIMLRVGRAT